MIPSMWRLGAQYQARWGSCGRSRSVDKRAGSKSGIAKRFRWRIMQGRLKSYGGSRNIMWAYGGGLQVSSVHGYQPDVIDHFQASRGRNEKTQSQLRDLESLAEIPRGISRRKPSANLRSISGIKKCGGGRWKGGSPKKAVNVLRHC
jgi:hypothetical protein